MKNLNFKKNWLTIAQVALVFFMLATATAGVITKHRINKEIEQWTWELNSEIKLGATRLEVERWAQVQHLVFAWIPERNMYYMKAGKVNAVGLGIPCSSWSIIITIDISEDGRVSGKKIYSVGNCSKLSEVKADELSGL